MSILRSSLIMIFAAALTASGAGAASTHKKSSARAASHTATDNSEKSTRSDGVSRHKTHSDDAPAASSRRGKKHSDDAPVASSSKAHSSDDASTGTRKSRKTGSADKAADTQTTASHKPCRARSHRCKAAAAAETASSDNTSGSSDSSTSGKSRSRRTAAAPAKPRLHGQQAISSERVTEIQQALIRQHYLNKEADGHWDGETEAAMQKFQADQGWQTKLMPDSRALMKLGLGPDYSNAINAKTGNFAPTTIPGNLTQDQTAGFTAGSGVSR